jgi:hypothetical protein
MHGKVINIPVVFFAHVVEHFCGAVLRCHGCDAGVVDEVEERGGDVFRRNESGGKKFLCRRGE